MRSVFLFALALPQSLLAAGVVDGLPLHLPDQSGQGDGNVGKHEDGEGKYVQDLLVGRNLDLLPLAEHSQSAEEQQAQVEVTTVEKAKLPDTARILLVMYTGWPQQASKPPG